MANETAIKQKFQPGDRIVQDLNPADALNKKEILITHGVVLEYRIMPGTSVLSPYVEWDDGRQAYIEEQNIEASDKPLPSKLVDTSMDTAIDVQAIAVSPGLERLQQLELDISTGFEEVNTGIRRIQIAAAEIKEDSLWEEAGYPSFEDYGEKKWGWKKSNLYDLASAGKNYQALVDSGIPENEIPESTSAVNALAKAPNPAEIIEDAKVTGEPITVASVKRRLKNTPSIELLIALWRQLGMVKQSNLATNPERLIVSGELFETPRTFESVKDAQAAWEQEGQKLAAIAHQKKIKPDPEAKRGLCNVPCKIVNISRSTKEECRIMGEWSEGVKDAAGNEPKAWDYPVMLPSSPIMRSLHLYQIKVLWADTHDWRPQAYQPAHPSTPASPQQHDYQPRETSPLYKPDDVRGQQKQAIAQGLPKMAPFPTGNYSLIVADPSWTYNLREADPTHRGRTPYPNMSDEEILTLPMADLAAKDAYLLLWTTKDHLPLAFDCLAVWGFTYKSIHTWVKISKSKGEPRSGTGHYGRNCAEYYLVATRGKPYSWTSLGLTTQQTVFHAIAPKEHSRKPEEFWEERALPLRKALGGDAIELFARQKRDRWDSWGLESH